MSRTESHTRSWLKFDLISGCLQHDIKLKYAGNISYNIKGIIYFVNSSNAVHTEMYFVFCKYTYFLYLTHKEKKKLIID